MNTNKAGHRTVRWTNAEWHRLMAWIQLKHLEPGRSPQREQWVELMLKAQRKVLPPSRWREERSIKQGTYGTKEIECEKRLALWRGLLEDVQQSFLPDEEQGQPAPTPAPPPISLKPVDNYRGRTVMDSYIVVFIIILAIVGWFFGPIVAGALGAGLIVLGLAQ